MLFITPLDILTKMRRLFVRMQGFCPSSPQADVQKDKQAG
jgi:hypothetical protein